MAWRSLGRVFHADGQRPWLASHASCPQAQHVEGDLFRIWFAPRDAANRSHCAWLEIEITRADRIVRLADRPALGPGALGAFDERGAMFSWLHQARGRLWLYYTGWTIGDSVPFRNAIGLATADADAPQRLTRASVGPVLDRSPADPYFVGNPCVLEADGLWHLWYLSGVAWRAGANGAPPSASYNLRHAVSDDGLAWRPDPEPAIDFAHGSEMAIARPSVLHDEGRFRMWFCYRGDGFPYRIGHAVSPDGARWERDDGAVPVIPSGEGWDSEMICYPHVFAHRGQRYMLYCGNGFSAAGFGLAVWDA